MKRKKEGLKQRIVYSEEYRKWVVTQIEEHGKTVLQMERELNLEDTTIYKWLYKYSNKLKKKGVLVMQKESEEEKTKGLLKKVAELERIIGQKQMKIDFLEKMIEIGSDQLGVDIKKKFSTPPSTGLEQTGKDTSTD